jgi:hypothetical protein
MMGASGSGKSSLILTSSNWQQKPAKPVKNIGVWVEKSTLNTYFLSGCAASSGEGVPIWLIVAII